MAITIAQINTAIADDLETATGLGADAVQDFDELSEGINDTPMLQVYWFDTTTDPTSGAAQSSFRGVVRQTSMTFRADLYARQRSHIGEDMEALLPLIDAIQIRLEAQKADRFGLEGVKAIERWTARQVVFETAGVGYVGARFEIKLRVF